MFSVVIPSHERVDELVRAVKSVLIQTEYLDKLIIVDDKSKNANEIWMVINSLGSSKIELILNEKKSNAAHTRNQGARLAPSEWICFLDSDDEFFPDKLNKLKTHIQKHPGCDVIYNKAKVYMDEGFSYQVPTRALDDGEHISDYIFLHGQMMQTSMLVIKKDFFIKRGFDETLSRHQDFDLCLSLFEAGYKFSFLDECSTAVYWTSSQGPKDKGETIAYSMDWVDKNKKRLTTRAYNVFVFYWVALKAVKSGRKILGIKIYLNNDNSDVPIKKKIDFIALLILPIKMHNVVFKFAKKIKQSLLNGRIKD